ncbi:hypothetical protein [Leifsonia sp. TF02-11]|uniref:hypothetical protein n=1 Tax=Leifsonia sp. TF02-11 TaxID=2815212 RepID=UPI001AA0DB0E|nr:hypothetical protein [Leifsonia sp. TF02-11]MBO1737922.1 hypothetical protein [Leifsonia sp. TF02-11]
MSATPRIVFSMFRSSSDPMFLAWARFLQAVEAGARRTASVAAVTVAPGAPSRPLEQVRRAQPVVRAVPATAPCGVWRVLAPNNRELGRSARAYTSFASARAHVTALRASVDELGIVAVNGERAGMSGWYVTRKGLPVITCGRWYGAAASGATAALAALDALAVAVVEDSPRRLEPPRRAGVASDDVVW